MTADFMSHDEESRARKIPVCDAPYWLREAISQLSDAFQPAVEPHPTTVMVWGTNNTKRCWQPDTNDNEARSRLASQLSILASNQNIDAIALCVEGRAILGVNDSLTDPSASPGDVLREALGKESLQDAVEYLKTTGMEMAMSDVLHITYETRTDCYNAMCVIGPDRQLHEWTVMTYEPPDDKSMGKLQGFFIRANHILTQSFELQERDNAMSHLRKDS